MKRKRIEGSLNKFQTLEALKKKTCDRNFILQVSYWSLRAESDVINFMFSPEQAQALFLIKQGKTGSSVLSHCTSRNF